MQVYLDNSATTRPSDAVVDAMCESMRSGWYNPSALYRPAMEAEKKLTHAREAVLAAAGAKGQRCIFTSGGTEADNIAILGFLRTLKKGGRVLFTSVEHPAVSACAGEIERLGFTAEEIAVDKRGAVDLEKLEAQLDDSVQLICVMQVNNESGAVQPIEEIVSLRNRICPKCAIHVDGVQGFLRVPLMFNKLGIQSYALSGHKIHAPKGIGALIVAKNHRINPIVFGGGQEENYRSGTENTPGIVALGTAVETYPADGVSRMKACKRYLAENLTARIPGSVINGPALEDAACSPHVLNISLPPVRSQTMLFALEGEGIYVSAGSACASKKQKLSPVLSAMGVDPMMADCALRFSFSPENTIEQMDYVIEKITAQYEVLKKFVRR